MNDVKLQVSIGLVIAAILFILGAVLVIAGVSTMTSPLTHAMNQTPSTFPQYVQGTLSSTFVGGIIVAAGVVFIAIALWIAIHL